jgi:hypothetical protein
MFCIGGVAVALGGGTDTPRAKAPSQTFSPSPGDGADGSQNQAAPTFENGVLTTPDMKIEITHYEVINAGAKGNKFGDKPVIVYWYKTTNISGKRLDAETAWDFTFSAFQDNNPNRENELDSAILFDGRYNRFSDGALDNIKKGGTVANVAGYELDDLVTPVDLVASELFGKDIGKATYKLK